MTKGYQDNSARVQSAQDLFRTFFRWPVAHGLAAAGLACLFRGWIYFAEPAPVPFSPRAHLEGTAGVALCFVKLVSLMAKFGVILLPFAAWRYRERLLAADDFSWSRTIAWLVAASAGACAAVAMSRSQAHGNVSDEVVCAFLFLRPLALALVCVASAASFFGKNLWRLCILARREVGVIAANALFWLLPQSFPGPVGVTLGRMTTFTAASLLRLAGEHAEILLKPGVPPLVVCRQFWVSLAPECSGIEGLTLFVLLFFLIVLIESPRVIPARAVALTGVAMLIAFGTNAVRIAMLIWIGANWSPATALGGFHASAGLVLFAVSFSAFIWLALPWMTGKGKSETSPDGTG